MPTTVPIEGAGTAPFIDVIYGTFSSVDILGSADTPAFSGSEVLWTIPRAALQAVDIKKTDPVNGFAGLEVTNIATVNNVQALDIVAGDSFVILADVLAASLSGPHLGSFGQYEINAVLLVNSVEVAIKSFSHQVPTGKLGSILHVVLAKPDVSQVPSGASITFSLLVTVNGVTASKTLISNGKLQERSYTIAYRGGSNDGPQDEVTFSSLDVISDKFGLAPRRPVTMFDPNRVRMDAVRTRDDQMTRDEYGRRILPILEPVRGLSMRQILSRAYTGVGGAGFISPGADTGHAWSLYTGSTATEQRGAGFDAVITNVPDYPVRRADFTIEGGWHDGAQPVVAMFGVLYFVHLMTLFIMDVDRTLPFGISAHIVTLAKHKSLQEQLNYKPDANAVLLTYQYNGNDPSEDPLRESRDVFHDEVIDETGIKGTAGYSKSTVRRWDREFYMPDDPTTVLDTIALSSDTETIQTVVWYDTSGGVLAAYDRLIHQETIDYLYEGDVLMGHTRTVKAAVPDPGAGFRIGLFIVELEECEVSWETDPNNAGVRLQTGVRTDISGVCVWGPDTETVDEAGTSYTISRPIPILQAYASGIVENGWQMSSLIPIKNIRKTLQNMKGQQFNVEVVETDLLNNTHKRSYVDPTTGSISNDPYATKSRNQLIRDLVSEAEIGTRIPVPLNTFELPRVQAVALAHRVLKRFKNPLMSLPIQLTGVDFVLERGSIIQGQKRSGYTTNYFVTGYTINGTNLGKAGHRINQTLEATEMLTV